MSGDDWARVIYLGLLLMVLLGLFGSGGRNFGKGLRDALIWVLIFAMAIIAYGFRDKLRDGLFPENTIQISADTIELRRRGDGHFMADLLVNDVTVRFIIDTGATQVVLSREDATRAGIDLDNLQFLGRAITANGVISTATVRIDRMRFGEFTDRDVMASVGSGDLGISLLGMDYLDRFSKIEITGDRMSLTR